MNDITVSVVMITYRHEKFIGQGIRSILEQKCSFNYELIISDDFSPDKTEEIINNYSEKLPSVIRYYRHNKNVGMMRNFIFALNQAKGKYIAICDGDDYWTDTLKLQKQVDFLENNLDFAICFHRAQIIYDGIDLIQFEDINQHTPAVTTIDDIVVENYIHTPTVMYRNKIKLPDWFEFAYPGDWPLNILNATKGRIKFLDEVMSCYRVHSGGVHSTRQISAEKVMPTLKNIGIELEKMGFVNQSKKIFKRYDNTYAYAYGLENAKSYSRIKRSIILITKGSFAMKALFFFPIFFGDKSSLIWRSIAGKINKSK